MAYNHRYTTIRSNSRGPLRPSAPGFYPWLSLVNPLTLFRGVYLRGLRGWRSLLRAPSPGARIFLLSSFFWAVPMALTEPFKQVYLIRLGFNNLQLGGLNGLDMGLKIVGVLAGAWLGMRFGYRRVLVLGDLVSWVISTLILAVATEPWHVVVWAVLMSSNGLVSASVQHLILDGTRQERRAATFALFNVIGVIPTVLLPFIASLVLKRFEFMDAMRVLWVLQALSIALGIFLRWRRLPLDVPKRSTDFSISDSLREVRLALQGVWSSTHAGLILALFVFANLSGNLWRVYFSVYAVQSAGLKEEHLGSLAQIGSLAFVVATLGLLPRLGSRGQLRAFLLVILTGFIPPMMIWLWHDVMGFAVMSLVGGAGGAVHGAVMGALMAAIFPHNRLALAFAAVNAALQVILALAFPIFGGLYELNFEYFPQSIVLFQVLQAILAWRLIRAPGAEKALT